MCVEKDQSLGWPLFPCHSLILPKKVFSQKISLLAAILFPGGGAGRIRYLLLLPYAYFGAKAGRRQRQILHTIPYPTGSLLCRRQACTHSADSW